MPRKRTGLNLTPFNSQLLNPSLFHKVKLLNSNIVDVITAVNQIIEINPFIEIDYEEPNEELVDKDEPEKEKEDDVTSEEFDISLVEDFFERDDDIPYLSKRKEKDSNLMEKLIMFEDSTKDKLKKIIRADFDNQLELIIAEYIIDNLDEKGFLELTEEEIRVFLSEIEITNKNPDLDFFENVRQKILSMKPYGIAAYNTKESLIVQAEYRNLKHKETIKKIIEEDFQKFANNNEDILLDKYNLSEDEFKEIMEEIKLLTPYPADMITDIKPEYIIPDVIVTKEDGDYEIYLNDENYPKPRLNSYYKKIIEQMKWQRNKDAKFIRAKFEEAINFIKSLDYRNSSLYKVTKAIVEIQKEFFEKGTEYIKPLNLRTISEITEIHESAISRIVSNKYVLTPKGVFRLKFFFSSSFQKVGGGTISSKSIKEKIKNLIKEENYKAPLTDQQIVELLAKDGINIKRRTVAKYRDMLGIPSSKARKKMNKNKEVKK
jgi:RNA polymerase sigma-54 factor